MFPFHPWQNRKWSCAVVVVLALMASLGAYCAAWLAFQWMPVTTDENSYIFQAHCFLEGILARPVPFFPEAFHYKMLIMTDQTGWLSRYAPGHALFLIPGVVMGSPHLLIALSAGVCVVVVARTAQLVGGQAAAVSAALLLALSPFFLFHHGTLLSHTSGVLAVALMLWCHVLWRKTGRTIFAILAGLAWAWLFANRTYTALLLSLPFAVEALIFLWQHRNRKVLLSTLGFALASASGVVILVAYNYLTIGDPWTMTYLFYNPTDNLGFGPRYYDTVEHTWARGLENMVLNLRALNIWLAGFWGSALVWLGLSLAGWTRRWTLLCCSAVFVVILGYVFFWYPGPEEAGPGYYLEILPFFVLAAALGAARLASRLKPWMLAGAVMLLVLASGGFMVHAGQGLRDATSYRARLSKVLRAAPENSLVIINPRDFPEAFDRRGNDIIFNVKGLESPVLLARSLGPQNVTVIRYFSRRTPYRLTGDETPALKPLDPGAALRIVLDAQDMHRHTGTNIADPSGQGLLRVAGEEHEPGFLAFGRSYYVAPGSYSVVFALQADGPGLEEVAFVDVVADGGRTVLASAPVTAPLEPGGIELLITVADFTAIEPRVSYAGRGSVTLQEIRIVEQR
jgi:hypothetical protein